MTTLLERAIAKLNAGRKVPPSLKHAMDSSTAKELFQALHAEGVALPFSLVHETAMRCGWQPSDATELAKLAERIGTGGRVVIRNRRGWGQEILSRLKAEMARPGV